MKNSPGQRPVACQTWVSMERKARTAHGSESKRPSVRALAKQLCFSFALALLWLSLSFALALLELRFLFSVAWLELCFAVALALL